MTTEEPRAVPSRHDFEQQALALRAELLAHCYRLTGSAVDAEDQVQETYLRAWRGLPDFDGRASLRTWLYRIATNSCLNHLASASRRVLPSGLGAPPGDPEAPLHRGDHAWLEPLPDALLWSGAAPTPEERLLARENLALAWTAALQTLSPNQRAVLLLRDVLQLSAAETAETLGTSVASVNSALQRGRAAVGTDPTDGAPGTSAGASAGTSSGASAGTSAATSAGAPAETSRGTRSPGDRDALEERAVAGFVDAFEAHHFDAVVAALAEDCTWQMPPFDRWYSGNLAAARLSWTHCPARGPGDLRFLRALANGQPAVRMYLRKGRDHEAFQLQVLHVDDDGLIDQVVGWFEPHWFRLAGLPLVLPR
ncbi:RNA polymerase subunit sigma-70 [Arsenicicoccus sp. oral taxon 190]|uniref:RNA polymerase subunit sigma-70 n=1 Tax=Arsenicicoccus sp. oral taxon 190 TaxID=1658671 RepID=UPI00067A4147|nr:RNA polymerase subunit sigma-70 [Arsenicicoccus sp. oral taxon 190]AKT52117.1 hypothetical protein ADJ73_14025 [Arsenicicoccus sp. oral taxon 190]